VAHAAVKGWCNGGGSSLAGTLTGEQAAPRLELGPATIRVPGKDWGANAAHSADGKASSLHLL